MAFNAEYVKAKTIELYDSLPQDVEERKSSRYFNTRDEIFTLNQAFFGYIAAHTFINNSSISYEDKYQSACSHFMECWWWYHCKETHPKSLRLSFTVFYKPRIGEMIERELNEVKYSVRRSLCMEAGEQLGKHWGQVKYDDLAHVSLPADKMNSLKAIFGTLYWADLADHELYIESEEKLSIFEYPDDNYNTLEEFLVHEMCEQEKKLTDADLMKLSKEYNLDYIALKEKRDLAEDMLYKRLKKATDFIEMQDTI